MRRTFLIGMPEDFRRGRDLWQTRSQKQERFQNKKEEVCELFERQLNFKQIKKEEFEEEFKREIQGAVFRIIASREEPEKNLQKWTSELQKAAQTGERRKPGRGRENTSTPKDVRRGTGCRFV